MATHDRLDKEQKKRLLETERLDAHPREWCLAPRLLRWVGRLPDGSAVYCGKRTIPMNEGVDTVTGDAVGTNVP